MSGPADELVAVGRVIKPHGIRGEVVVDVLSDVPGRLDAGETVVLDGVEVVVVASRPHQGRLLVRLASVPDRTAAEQLRGKVLQAPAADVEESDDFYAHELVGLAVRADDGQALGTVEGIVLMPDVAGYDLLEVRHPDGHRWLLPSTDDLVDVEEDGQTYVLVVHDAPVGLVHPDAADPAAPDASGGQEQA